MTEGQAFTMALARARQAGLVRDNLTQWEAAELMELGWDECKDWAVAEEQTKQEQTNG